MHIDDMNKSNFVKYRKMIQTAIDNQKQGRTEQSCDPAAQKAENPARDTVDISMDARQSAREAKNEMQDILAQYQMLTEQFENARAQGDAIGEEMDMRIKCMKIAMRIMAGDKVPKEDLRYLIKNDPGLYARAIMMKTENKKPKKHKRLSEDEETGDKEDVDDSSNNETQPVSDEGQESQEGVGADAPEGSEAS